jgi:serine phosphatase RsbU (regulator of sigma subunit)
MRLGIRFKLAGILVLAAVVPLVIGLVALQTMGYRHLVREKGLLSQGAAEHVARLLALSVSQQVGSLRDLMLLTNLPDLVQRQNDARPVRTDAEFEQYISRLETRWPALAFEDVAVREVLTNDVAALLQTFQSQHPLIAELFVTDDTGRVIASTEKTSNYWQADESWWQEAIQFAPGGVGMEGLHFDSSAAVFSLDVALPIHTVSATPPPPAGVLKAVLDVSPLFSSVPLVLSEQGVRCDVVMEDGRILVRLFEADFVPLEETISPEAVSQLTAEQPGWMVVELAADGSHMVGYSPLDLTAGTGATATPSGLGRMYLLVSEPTATVLAPVRRLLVRLTLVGCVLVLGFALGGFYLAGHGIVSPLQVLRSATDTLAATAKLETAASDDRKRSDLLAARAALEQTSRIQTGDEIESLAGHFGQMARNLTQYHEHLEEEIAAKTAAIQQDLVMAREFQLALLPQDYPRVPSDQLELHFHPVYRPTLTVGGDFYDLLELSDHRAGVFIADVMGHGARSALVTAILRTLVHNWASQANDPADFLEHLNRDYHDIIRQTNQSVFVSALLLVADTQQANLEYASAGHPSPLRANRRTGTVELMIERLRHNPALGLFPESTYSLFTGPLRQDDVFLFFTDGVTEASNPEGEEFGRDRLMRVLQDNLHGELAGLSQAIVEAVHQFTGTTTLTDDFCLVTLEAVASPPAAIPASFSDPRPGTGPRL